ncbi:MAG TPA: SRPBCC family protein [Saprospiraceae bacterium]|nr:SRPBCC family protein [Saprospiraceae bacterium]
MKNVLKKIGLWLGLFLLALILISFLLPSEIKVKRSIEVSAPIDRVFDQVNDLRNWEKWAPWKRMDPSMVMTFSNPPVGQNAFYKWESQDKRMGTGTLTLSSVTMNEEIVTSMDFGGKHTGSSKFQFTHKGDNIEVTWSMNEEVGMLPWNKYFGLMMRGELKKQYDNGLKGLKFYAEKS